MLRDLHNASLEERKGILAERVNLIRSASSTDEHRMIREEMGQKFKNVRASTTEMRTNIKDEAQKRRFELAHRQTDLIVNKIDTAIDRVQKLSERISGSLDGLESKGVDTASIKEGLVNVNNKLDEARTKSASIKLAMEEAFASETPKESLNAVKDLIKDTQNTIKETFSSLKDIISLVKSNTNNKDVSSAENNTN